MEDWIEIKKLRIKDGRHELYFGVYNYSVVGMFSWTSWNNCISQTRHWSILWTYLQQVYKFEGSLYVQLVCLVVAASSSKFSVPPSPKT